MFIAISTFLKARSARSETGRIASGKGDCAPTELPNKEDRQAINISPLWGRRNKQGSVATSARIREVQHYR
jgi:hypothetical protein